MTEPRWLTFTLVLSIHADQIREHGGAGGVRDKALLESALARPANLFSYAPEADLAALGAAYAYGIARNHPFIDGNKRMAFQAMYVFFGLNGLRIVSSEEEVVEVMISLASGELSEATLTEWLREHTEQR